MATYFQKPENALKRSEGEGKPNTQPSTMPILAEYARTGGGCAEVIRTWKRDDVAGGGQGVEVWVVGLAAGGD
jgi:hypothetical protein